jgi:hypothetical protein
MSDICVERTNLPVKDEKTSARCSSPIGINALSPNEDVVYKREETRKLFSPIGSPMTDIPTRSEKAATVSHSAPIPTPTSQSNSHNPRSLPDISHQVSIPTHADSSFGFQQTSKQQAPHHIAGLFSGASDDRTTQFIKSFSPATNNDSKCRFTFVISSPLAVVV